MVERKVAPAPSNGASATLRRSERIEKQQVAAMSSITTEKSASSSSKRKRGNAQTKATKALPRKTPVPERKTTNKTSKNAANRSKPNPKYQSLRSRDNAAEELPHNLGRAGPGAALEPTGSDKENRALNDENASSVAADLQVVIDTAASNETAINSTPKKRKASGPAYRLTPGKTPYPDLRRPTPEECEEVNRLLSEIHGEVIQPAKIPEPSLSVTGCGEVPSVLDALIRTLLSGATSGNNSALAFDGLVKRFGILKEGIGKGSVNWDAVRQAPLKGVFEAIKRGGLAAIKSKSLKAILDKVYEENQAQRDRLKASDESNDDKVPSASSQKAEQAKEYEIACAEQHVLSLNHLHALSTEEVMTELTKYPGIGPKTAACVNLFCLQRPCFAVDTHIFRITKWLGWVPSHATEVTAFSHLEVRIPNHLKYSLHQLFIRHGKSCPRCRAITGEKSAGWEEGCIIDHLVRRTGVRKGGAAVPAKRKRSTASRKRKRGTAGKKKKQAKAKGSRKKVTPATGKSTRSTRKTTVEEESTSTTSDAADTDVTDDAASSPAGVDEDTSSSDAETPESVSPMLPSQAPVSDETSTPTTPTPEKDNAIGSPGVENCEHNNPPTTAIEEGASTRTSPEPEAIKTLEEKLPNDESKKDSSDEKEDIAKDGEEAE